MIGTRGAEGQSGMRRTAPGTGKKFFPVVGMNLDAAVWEFPDKLVAGRRSGLHPRARPARRRITLPGMLGAAWSISVTLRGQRGVGHASTYSRRRAPWG
jgi:hypothetical protein